MGVRRLDTSSRCSPKDKVQRRTSTTHAPNPALIPAYTPVSHARTRPEQPSARDRRYVEKTHSCDVVILDEQPNKGRNLLEKFRFYGTENCAAIVLVTGDDVGRLATEPPEQDQKRPRPNVVFEWGYFTGLLPPDRVVVLYEPGVEMPSDVGGMAYISLDGDWRAELTKELRGMGL